MKSTLTKEQLTELREVTRLAFTKLASYLDEYGYRSLAEGVDEHCIQLMKILYSIEPVCPENEIESGTGEEDTDE